MLPRLRKLQRTRFARALWLLLVNLDRYAASRAASAMAFDAFLSLIPLTAVAGFLLHRLHSSSQATLGPLLRAMPMPVIQLIDSEFLRLSDAGIAIFAPLVLLAFAWVSSAGLSTAMGVFECIYIGSERAWWKRRIIAIGLVLAGLAITVTVTAIGIAIAAASSTAGLALGFVLPVVGPVLLVAAFFRIATQRSGGPRRRLFPGAILTVALWALSSTLFSFYVSRIASYGTLYGNLATVAVMLLWLWIASLALLVGGEVNALLDGIGLDDLPESVVPIDAADDDLAAEAMVAKPVPRTAASDQSA